MHLLLMDQTIIYCYWAFVILVMITIAIMLYKIWKTNQQKPLNQEGTRNYKPFTEQNRFEIPKTKDAYIRYLSMGIYDILDAEFIMQKLGLMPYHPLQIKMEETRNIILSLKNYISAQKELPDQHQIINYTVYLMDWAPEGKPYQPELKYYIRTNMDRDSHVILKSIPRDYTPDLSPEFKDDKEGETGDGDIRL